MSSPHLVKLLEKHFKKLYIYVENVPKELAHDVGEFEDCYVPSVSDWWVYSVSFQENEEAEKAGYTYLPRTVTTNKVHEYLSMEFPVKGRKARYFCSLEVLYDALRELE